uniref:Uncharacterized protein n=1 Tax=Anguilla anguilla TaxID=7936 RepID=A0A0E9RFL0_ANGAN
MVTFFVAHTYTMSAPGPIRFNNLYVNYGVVLCSGDWKVLHTLPGSLRVQVHH